MNAIKQRFSYVFLIITLGSLAGCTSSDFDVWKADRLAAASRSSYKDAVWLYKKALAASPSGRLNQSIRFKLAKLYFEGGDYAAAAEVFKQLDSKEAKRMLAISYFKDSDFTGALEVFNKNKDVSDDAYRYYYGRTLEKSNLYDQALQVYALIRGPSLFAEQAKERIGVINLVSHGTAFAGVSPDIVELIKASPGLKEYPDASGLYLFVDEKIELTDDHCLESVSHACVKILNDRGKEKFAEVVLQYDSTYEKLEVEYARTIKPDGTVVTVGDKNIRDVSLYLNFPLYSNARVRIISMPDVSSGCVIEYKVKLLRNRLPNDKDFNTAYWLAMDDPILWERFQISIPKDRSLKHKIVNGEYNFSGFDMQPKEEALDGRKIYSLEFKNVPQIIPEPMMPSGARSNPYVLFSTFDDWQGVYSWWRGLYRDKMAVDAAMQAKVDELTAGKTTQEAKIRAIYNFCAAQIRYVAVEYGDAGHEPHKAGEVFENKYGDCKDKAILLITMLKAARIEAYPVLISTFGSFDVQPDVASILFNHAITAVRLDGEFIFMDSTGSTVSFKDLPFGDQGRTVLVFLDDKYELFSTPLFPSEHNRLLTRMEIKMAPDESITARRQVEAEGVNEQAQRYWLKYTMPSLIEEDLKQKIRSIAHNAELIKYEIENVDDLDKPVLFKYTFRAPEFFTKAGKIRLLDQLSSLNTDMVVKNTRHYPLEFSGLEQDEGLIDIGLPANLAVKYLPLAVMQDNKWFYCLSEYKLSKKNVIQFRWLFRMKVRGVDVADYASFKEAIEKTALKLDQKLLLEKK